MINVSGYGDGPEFEIPASSPPPQKPETPAVSYAYREPVPLFWRVGDRKGKPRFPWLLTTGAAVIAAAGCLIGVAMCLTILLIPLGVPFVLLACFPLHKVLDRYARKNIAWENRDRPLDEDTVKPWELT